MADNTDKHKEIEHWSRCLSQVGRTGDRALYLSFYDHFSPRLQSWLLGLTHDRALAEELTQEAMLAVWRKAHQYDADKAAASTWLFRIARNLYIDQLRRRQVQARGRNWLTEEDTRFAEHSADAERVRQAIRQLPQQQAQVIYKSYFEGKSHQEIANDMDIPLGSVKSSLRLAFQKLCTALRP